MIRYLRVVKLETKPSVKKRKQTARPVWCEVASKYVRAGLRPALRFDQPNRHFVQAA